MNKIFNLTFLPSILLKDRCLYVSLDNPKYSSHTRPTQFFSRCSCWIFSSRNFTFYTRSSVYLQERRFLFHFFTIYRLLLRYFRIHDETLVRDTFASSMNWNFLFFSDNFYLILEYVNKKEKISRSVLACKKPVSPYTKMRTVK